MKFQKAARKRAKLRLAISGPSGSGKTMSALLIAKGMGGKIALIDTERESASLYSHVVDFDTLPLNPPYTPERFIEATALAAEQGYDICIIDSITHEWDGSGGCLEINEQIAQAKFRGNTWAAWNETTPRHRAFIDTILQSPMHVIATMRSKTETVQGDDKKVKKLGMKVVQREGTDYEFTVLLDLEHEKHYAVASKDRTNLFSEPHVISTKTGERILAWLDSGAIPALSEHETAEHLAKINGALDVTILRRTYQAAYKAAIDMGDAARLAEFETAKDARKAVLAAKASEEAATLTEDLSDEAPDYNDEMPENEGAAA